MEDSSSEKRRAKNEQSKRRDGRFYSFFVLRFSLHSPASLPFRIDCQSKDGAPWRARRRRRGNRRAEKTVPTIRTAARARARARGSHRALARSFRAPRVPASSRRRLLPAGSIKQALARAAGRVPRRRRPHTRRARGVSARAQPRGRSPSSGRPRDSGESGSPIHYVCTRSICRRSESSIQCRGSAATIGARNDCGGLEPTFCFASACFRVSKHPNAAPVPFRRTSSRDRKTPSARRAPLNHFVSVLYF